MSDLALKVSESFSDLCQTSEIEHMTNIVKSLKLVFTIFYQSFIFSLNDSPLKAMKNVFYFI